MTDEKYYSCFFVFFLEILARDMLIHCVCVYSENPRLYQCPVKIYEYISPTPEIQSEVDVTV